MNLDFKGLFPLASTYNADEYIDTCHFYFDGQDEILNQCIAFVKGTKEQLLEDNSFALKKCQEKGERTKTCCKTYAKSNDMAYSICVDNLVKPHQRMMYGTSITIVIIALLVLASFWFVTHRKTPIQKKVH